MKMFRSNSESNPNKISWTQIVNAIVHCSHGTGSKLVRECLIAMLSVELFL